MEKWFYLIGGGVLGTLARFVLVGVINQKIATGFPYGTLVVNLMGCFLVGFFDTIFHEKFFVVPCYGSF